MATAYTKSDALGWYGSDPAGLGGIRSDVELCPLEPYITDPIGPIIVRNATTGNNTGDGQIRAASTTTLAYTAPGDTEGTPVTVAANTSALLESGTPGMAVRVYRDSVYNSADLGGTMGVSLYRKYNTVIAGPNVDEAGSSYYGCVYFKNHGTANITSISIRPGVLGTQRTSSGGQLSGSGGGTITASGSLSTWPTSGWARIVESGVGLREIIYYSSRTDTVLTVPAAGRALCGTSASAGAASDTITPIAPLSLWGETPSGGEVQTIANHTTAPTSPTWGVNVTVATLEPGEERALWLFRQVPAAAVVNLEQVSGLEITYTYDGTTYTDVKIRDRFRIGNTALAGYELYNGADTAPDFDAAPLETSATLPFSEPLTNSAVNNYAVRYRNKYNLTSFNVLTEARELDGSAVDITNALTDPEIVSVDSIAGGEIAVTLRYNATADATRADTWRLYITDDGTTPDPGTDTPADTTMLAQGLAPPTITQRIVIGPYDYGTAVKFIARVYSTTLDDESASITVTTETVDTQVPVRANWLGLTTGAAFGHQRPAYESETDYGDATVRIITGETVVYASAEAFRGVLGNGAELRTTLEFSNVAHSAAGTSAPIETTDANTIYINVASTRRAKIDLSAGTIEAATFEFEAAAIALPVIGPIYMATDATYIQIFNGLTGRWTPLIKVDSSGVLTATLAILQEAA